VLAGVSVGGAAEVAAEWAGVPEIAEDEAAILRKDAQGA